VISSLEDKQMSRTILRSAWLLPIILVVFAWILLFFKATIAQPTLTSLSGTVVGPDGSAVSEAPVRAQNLETGTDGRTYSSATGRYEIEALPIGDYILSVEMPCCAFAPYVNENVVLEPGQPLEFDIRLAEGTSLNALGDDPGTINAEIRNRQVIPDLPVPRTSDGRHSWRPVSGEGFRASLG
jgi:hypothetical protein